MNPFTDPMWYDGMLLGGSSMFTAFSFRRIAKIIKKHRQETNELIARVMGKKSMYRYEVPVDGQAHLFDLSGEPVHVGTGTSGASYYIVEFWAEHDDVVETTPHKFQVFGTGHALPPDAFYVGTAPRNDAGLVFHLYERTIT